MEPLSFFTSIANFFKDWFAWVLKKCGYKIVRLDDFKEEVMEVDFDYPNKSAECIEETKNGAKFYWSEKYYIGYKKYFEIEGNVRRYYRHRNQILWIKK